MIGIIEASSITHFIYFGLLIVAGGFDLQMKIGSANEGILSSTPREQWNTVLLMVIVYFLMGFLPK